MRHFHLLMVFITLVLFIWQAYVALSSGSGFSKKVKITTHIVYALLIISGVLSVIPLLSTNMPLQWVGAKIILLVAAISASIKAFRPTVDPTQKKVGIVIASIAYIGIIILAITKPGNIF